MVFALLMSISGAACEFSLPFGSSSEESLSMSSETESTASTDGEQDEDDGSESDTAMQEAKKIMDDAYALSTGTTLSGTHTLTGTITYVDAAYSASKGICLYMDVLEPQSREMYCYQLKGVGADLIGVGDTITVQGTIKNYKGTVEFDKGCNLVSYILAEKDTPNEENDPYKDVSKSEFYASYTVATSNEDAYYRTQHGFMSGKNWKKQLFLSIVFHRKFYHIFA